MSSLKTKTICDCGFTFSREGDAPLSKEQEEALRQWCLHHVGHTCTNITEAFFDVDAADAVRASMLAVLNDTETVAGMLHEVADKVKASEEH